MGARKKEAVVVKKVRPYPILTKVTSQGASNPIEGNILRLTTIGFQMEVSQLYFTVGDIYQASFTLPLSDKAITETVKIIRTMDRFKDQRATVKGYLVEMHFTQLSAANAKSIREFEVAINQKPPA